MRAFWALSPANWVSPADVRRHLSVHEELVHVTVEIQPASQPMATIP